MEEERRLTQIADLCVRIGEVLMASGAGASDVTATMQAVAWAMGQNDPEIDVTFTSLSVSLDRAGEQAPVMVLRLVKHRALDYEVLTRVDRLTRDIVGGHVDLDAARKQMNQIVSAPHTLPRWAVTLAHGVMCAAVAVYLGGGIAVTLGALVAAMVIDRLQQRLTAQRLPVFYLQVAGGLVATLLALGLHALVPNTDSSLVVTANIMMLLAGIGFMGALQDALMGFYLTASARLLEAMLSTGGIIAGVSGGLALGRMAGMDLGILEPGRIDLASLPTVVLGGAISAAAFAVASRAPWRSWFPIAVVAGVGSVIFQVIDASSMGRTWAAGTAAFFVGLVAFGVSGRFKVPPLVVAVAAVVPFLPGLSIYRGLSLLATGLAGTVTGLLAMVTAVSVAVALAAGVLLGEYVAQPVKREARRLENRLAGPRMVGVSRVRRRRPRGSTAGQDGEPA
ncbi:threonine/serine exporter family protein [Nocardioides rotundus]|uniref:threonine/serine ThrE exporter family protein n=1 Tax=Nocardioides rotundus TaxID=1774216 RepID=UPI001CBAED09|nr:threonine/serine exporter family protein [Nocardioides rotundus]